MKIFARTMLSLAAAAALAVAAPQPAAKDPAKVAAKAPKVKAPKVAAAPAPTAAEITAAKAKGLVWVNTNTKVFHKDGERYGTTKHGKFMTEAEATAAGFHAAKQPGAKKAAKAAAVPKEAKAKK